MSFDWSQYLDIARELAEQAKSASPPLQEARLRASISRAYYAVFGKARFHLRRSDRIPEPNPLVDSNGEHMSIHQYVKEVFKNSSDQNRAEIGLTLERMLTNRNIADYYLDHPTLQNLPFVAQATLKWAREALAALNSLQRT